MAPPYRRNAYSDPKPNLFHGNNFSVPKSYQGTGPEPSRPAKPEPRVTGHAARRPAARLEGFGSGVDERKQDRRTAQQIDEINKKGCKYEVKKQHQSGGSQNKSGRSQRPKSADRKASKPLSRWTGRSRPQSAQVSDSIVKMQKEMGSVGRLGACHDFYSKGWQGKQVNSFQAPRPRQKECRHQKNVVEWQAANLF